MTVTDRVGPDGKVWTCIRSFTGAGRNLIAVIRSTDNHIRNVAMDRFESWPHVGEQGARSTE